MTLKELLVKIAEVQPLAEENVENGSMDTLNARRGRQRQAVEELGRLRTAVTNELRRTSAFVVVIGSQSKEFADIASNSYKAFAADPESYFKELVARVPASLYIGRESVSNLFDVLGRHIEEKAYALGIVGYQQLLFKQEYQRTIRDTADFLGIVKDAVTDQIGGEIVGIQSTHDITKSVIERKRTARPYIVLSTKDEKFGIKVANDLLKISDNVFFVTAGEATTPLKNTDAFYAVPEVTKEAVKKTLDTISQTLKKEELVQK